MKSFEEFLETYRNKLSGQSIRSEVIKRGNDCIATGKIIKNLQHDLVLRQCDDVFIFEKDEKMVMVQGYSQEGRILYLKSRQKFDTSLKGLFAKLLVELLSTNKYDYIEDDEAHTLESEKAIKNLFNDGRIEIRVYNSLIKKEDIVTEYMADRLLWQHDNSIRYYPKSTIKVPQSAINHLTEMLENVPTLDGLLYGIEI